MTNTTTPPRSPQPMPTDADEEPPRQWQLELADLADSYVRDRMTDEEREQFELRLMDDENALLQVELALALSDGLEANARVAAATPLRGRAAGPGAPEPSSGPRQVNVALPWTIAIAASLGCVTLLLQRPAVVPDVAQDAYTVSKQVLLGVRYRSAEGGSEPVPVTPPATGTVLFEIRLPRELADSVPTGQGVKTQLRSRDDGRLLLETQATVLSGYALIGIGADHLAPGVYDVTVQAPVGNASVVFPIEISQPGENDDA